MSHRSRLSGVRVLVVDDARYVLDVVTDMLQCNGANVTAVDSAEEALDIENHAGLSADQKQAIMRQNALNLYAMAC